MCIFNPEAHSRDLREYKVNPVFYKPVPDPILDPVNFHPDSKLMYKPCLYRLPPTCHCYGDALGETAPVLHVGLHSWPI